MRIAVESGGTIEAEPDEVLGRSKLEDLVDKLAEALVGLNDFEADVAINYQTREIDFFVVVEAAGPRQALFQAYELIDQALAAAGVINMAWDESHARRTDLIPV